MEKIKLGKNQIAINGNFSEENDAQTYDMIVFCHLRWQFVYQRPQHIISRMAKDLKVLLIEEPIAYEPSERNTANLQRVSDNLYILQPKVDSIDSIADILPKYIKNKSIRLAGFTRRLSVHCCSRFNSTPSFTIAWMNWRCLRAQTNI